MPLKFTEVSHLYVHPLLPKTLKILPNITSNLIECSNSLITLEPVATFRGTAHAYSNSPFLWTSSSRTSWRPSFSPSLSIYPTAVTYSPASIKEPLPNSDSASLSKCADYSSTSPIYLEYAYFSNHSYVLTWIGSSYPIPLPFSSTYS